MRIAIDMITGDAQRLIAAGANDKILEALYKTPAGITGQNIRQFTSISPANREHALAEIWLFSIVGRYEVWADSLPWANPDRGAQFPSTGFSASLSHSNYRGGYRQSAISLVPAPVLATIYASEIAADPDYLSDSDIESGLLLYRFYKECRNSLAHRGGKANDRVVRLRAEAAQVASHLHIGASCVPTPLPLPAISVGDPVNLTLSDVRVLVSHLLRLVKSIDLRILVTAEGESEWLAKWDNRHGRGPTKVPKSKLRRKSWVVNKLREAGLPAPGDCGKCIQYLLDANRVIELI